MKNTEHRKPDRLRLLAERLLSTIDRLLTNFRDVQQAREALAREAERNLRLVKPDEDSSHAD